MKMESFLFVTSDVVLFEETKEKGALVECTMLELDKTSEQGTEYRFEEADSIAESLVGKPIFYGTNWKGKHDRTRPDVGKVIKTWLKGKRIKGLVRIIAKPLIERLKAGVKFLFSVGGVADFAESVKKAGRTIRRMINAVCTHLQIVDAGTKVGFPSAKMERLVEINETLILCEDGTCSILKSIKKDFEETEPEVECNICQKTGQDPWEDIPDDIIDRVVGAW
jgi:hypothetical protein